MYCERKLCTKKISHESGEAGFLKIVQDKLKNVCKEIDQYYIVHSNENCDQRPVYIKQDGVYLDTKKIIDKRAKLQYSVFLILVDHYFHEILNGSSYISSSEICSKLLKQYRIDIDEQRLRILIYKMRLNFKKTTNSQIIISENWRGYRLHDEIMLCRNHIN